MKKYFAVFVTLTALSAITAFASKEEPKEPIDEGPLTQKKCFKRCMKEVDDRDKCTYMCDPRISPLPKQ